MITRKSKSNTNWIAQSRRALVAIASVIVPLVAPIVFAQTPTASRPTTISVKSGRPLADALDKIEKLFGQPITFEEVPHQSPSYLKTLTVATGSGPRQVLFTPITDLSVMVDPASSTAYSAAQRALAAHVALGQPGIYTVVQRATTVDVTPEQVLNASGSLSSVTPIMSQPITFPLATRTGWDTLQLTVNQISAQSGARIVILNPFFSFNQSLALAATGESARDVISGMGAKLGTTVSFECLYDAGDRAYYLTIKGVNPPPPSGLTPPRGKTSGGSSAPSNSPFFTKAQ
ncbi:MAG TPA: hypothetical protein VH325_12400 [Bryobacteraceae bacterium]|jgi:hypothetical protein|nr:hypothetical protein [Bryobacteraceae bacterium]